LNKKVCSGIIDSGGTVLMTNRRLATPRKGVVVMEIVFVIAAIVTIVTGVFYIYDAIHRHFKNHNKK